MHIDSTTLALPAGRYFAEACPKDLIVLHFTAGGSAAGARAAWMSQKDQVATAYVVDLDGTCHQMFDPKFWAYHLGEAAEHHRNHKRSIAIEIVGFGPLMLTGDTLCSWPANYTTPFCKLSDTARYFHAPHPFRGFEYFTAFTPEQLIAVPQLVAKLAADFKIPVQLPPTDKIAAYDLKFFHDWKGIASHQNFRADKLDIGPAWPWGLIHA